MMADRCGLPAAGSAHLSRTDSCATTYGRASSRSRSGMSPCVLRTKDPCDRSWARRAWAREGCFMGQLDGKVAVVTGGSEGIGAATARRFAWEGATVFVTGRRQAELDTTVKEINAQHNGGQATGVQGDVSSLE